MHQQEFISGLRGLRPRHRGCVATIGSFDGVHLGHQAILARLRQMGVQMALPTLVMVFEPQPHEFFSRERAPARLTRLREKVAALFAAGVDRVLCLRFNEHLRQLSAQDFIDQLLVQKLGVAHLEIGDDFRFGCDRSGDFAQLQQAGRQFGFSVCDTPTFALGGERVSSTRVRQLLERDALVEATQLLGKRFGVSGRVLHGKRLGRKLDAPTANVGLGRYRSPVQGVYAVSVSTTGADARLQNAPGVANVGVRPTVNGGAKPLLEVHVLDFHGDLYGTCLRVEFLKKIRAERAFASIDQLKHQIQQDVSEARDYFAAFPEM